MNSSLKHIFFEGNNMSFRDHKTGYLVDPKAAIDSLNDSLALKDKSEFLFALYNVVLAQGFSEVSRRSGLNREGLYKILRPSGNPSISALIIILEAIGIELQVHPISRNASKITPIKLERINSIAHSYPALAAQWHPRENKSLSARDVLVTSRKLVWWLCPKNASHEWAETTLSRVNKFKKSFLSSASFTEKTFVTQLHQGCPHCARNNE